LTTYTSRGRSRLKRVLLALSMVFALVIVATGVGGYLIYRRLSNNITVDNSANGVLRHTSSTADTRRTSWSSDRTPGSARAASEVARRSAAAART
jgi:hypothetical protein